MRRSPFRISRRNYASEEPCLPPARLLVKKEIPPNLPVGQRGWSGKRFRGDDWITSRLTNGHHGLIPVLDVVSFGPCPIIDRFGGSGESDLGLEGQLGLDGLGRLVPTDLGLPVQGVEHLDAAVEINDHEDEDDDSGNGEDAAEIDPDSRHGQILPAKGRLCKHGAWVWYNFGPGVVPFARKIHARKGLKK